MIHELRTPLTAIHGYAQVVDRNPANEALVRRAGRVMLRESMRLSWMFTELSELAELSGPELVVEPDDVDLASLVATVAERAAQVAAHVTIEVGNAAPIRVRCDPRRVSQALWHLLLNAVKFTPEGGRIVVEFDRDDHAFDVSVADTGFGIVEAEASTIYQPFVRGSAATSSGERGLGLGLFLAAEVARRCGGRVWHEPRPKRGTTFHLRLPNAPAIAAY